MHRTLEETFEPNPPADFPGLAIRRDDVYREDPYRYDANEEGQLPSFAKLTEKDDTRRIEYLPTPAEIAGVAAEIRATWTKSEKRRRFVGQLPAEALEESLWSPPVVDTTCFQPMSHGVRDSV
ncbi:MAG: hypothetical protein AAGF31_11540 [Planctomycetota bacterium]